MSKKYFLIFVLFWLTPAFSHFNPVQVPSNQKPLSISLQTEFFRSRANYTKLLSYKDLDKEHVFLSVLFRPTISYAPTRQRIQFSIFMDNFYANSQQNQTYQSVFKPSLLGGGVDFYHKIQSFFVGLSVSGGWPLYNERNFQKNHSEIIVGDGVYYGEVGLNGLLKVNDSFRLYSRGAFRYRGSVLHGLASSSGLVFLHLGAVLDTKYISTGVSLDSFSSVLLSEYLSNNPQIRWNRLESTNAGSYKYYSVNPSVLSFTAWLEFNYHVFKTQIYLNVDTLGINYAKGLTLGLLTKWTFNTASQKNFLEKKKKQYLEFEEYAPRKSFTPTKTPSYFREEQDPYLDETLQDDSSGSQGDFNENKQNEELLDELDLLQED